MSDTSKPTPEIPPETYHATREVYHLDQVYLLIGDHLDEILNTLAVSVMDPTAGLGKSNTSRLALVTAFQYAERIPDDLAAQATLKRTDWKYALHLPVLHPGFPVHALCHFRQNLFGSGNAIREMKSLLEALGKLGLYGRTAIQTLDVREALLTICNITRMYQLHEAMKSALSMLVAVDPDWLRSNALPHWYQRYQTGRLGRYSELDNRHMEVEIQTIEADIHHLLNRTAETGGLFLQDEVEIRNLQHLWQRLGFHAAISPAGLSGCARCTGQLYEVR